VAELVRDLRERSEEFRSYWELGEVAEYRSSRRAFLHPRFGPVTVNTELLIPQRLEDHRIIAHFAADSGSLTVLETIAREAGGSRAPVYRPAPPA